jgi:integrase
MAQRLKGTGTVFQECTPTCPPSITAVDEDGKTQKVRPKHKCPGRWVGTYEAGFTKRGTRRRPKVTATTRKGAEQKLRQALIKAQEGDGPATAGGKPTVKVWAGRWLENRAETVRPKTWATDRSQITNWIVPAIGHRRLDQLTPGDIRAVHRYMDVGGGVPSSIQRAHAILGKMLRDAIMEGYAVPQRILLVEGPGIGENDRDAIPLPDALAILQVTSQRPDASRWVAALLQGMRPGECLGLTWDAVDLEAGHIDVSWQLQPLPYRIPRDRTSGFRVPRGYEVRQLVGAVHLVRPKSKSGKRVIPLVPWMAAALASWQEIAPASPHGLVWPRPDGSPQAADEDRALWYELCDAAQVAITEPNPGAGPEVHGRLPYEYEGRHTAATLLRAAGVDDSTITAIMGHASILSTMAYLHTDRARTLAALSAVAGTLGLEA